MVRKTGRFVVYVLSLVLMVAVLLTVTGGGQAASQADVCLNANVDYFLKIDGIDGESSTVSVGPHDCDPGRFAIAVKVIPATEKEIRTSPEPESGIVGIIIIGP